jgi:hypothetical protein
MNRMLSFLVKSFSLIIMRPIVVTMNTVIVIFDIITMLILFGMSVIIMRGFTVVFIKLEDKNYE